jgi:Tol biopolymer transport system component
VTDFDTLARAATQELLERSVPDTTSWYAELRRIRTRRTTARLVAVAAAVGLTVGGWQLLGPRERPVEPAPQPGLVRNGVLLGLDSHVSDPGAAWRPIDGDQPEHLPLEPAELARYQFTSSGDEVVYADRWGQISAVSLSTGNKRKLADCLDDACLAALSPSGSTIASTDGERVRLQSVRSGVVSYIPALGSGLVGAPAWSPDGTALAFVGAHGLYVVTVGSGEIRLVVSNPLPGIVTGPVSWSPTTGTVAYLVARPQRVDGYDETAYTATVVDLATGAVTPVLDAGHCFCAGVPAPSLTWSPDGTVIAVATTTDGAQSSGVYVVGPDGSDPERVKLGMYAALAWQPITG